MAASSARILSSATLRAWQREGPGRVLAGLVALLVVGALSGWLGFVAADRVRTLAETESELLRLVGLLEEHAHRTLGATDLVLRQLEERVDQRDLDALRGSAAMHQRLVALARDLPQVGSLYVLDVEGRVVASSLQQAPLAGVYADRDYFQALVARPDRLFIGELSIGRQTGVPFFSVSRAILGPDGGFRGVVVGAIHAAYFADFYQALGLGNGGSAGIVRTDGAILVREPPLPDPVGRRIQGIGVGLTAEAPAAVYQADSPFDGKRRVIAHRLVEGYPLAVAASRTLESAMAGWRTRAWQTGIGVVVLAGLALLLGHQGLRGVRRQRAMAQAMLDSRDALEERVRERTAELAASNADLSAAVAQKNLLLREVYHRVKNNLQQVDALIAMQKRRAPAEAHGPLEDTRRRISALGLVHQQLLESVDHATFNLDGFIGDLCRSIGFAMDARRRGIVLRVEADPFPIDLDLAIPLGLLANELISNAFKHAFPDGRTGTIVVEARATAKGLRLEVRDDGVGYDPAVTGAPSVGRQIIGALTAQLRGRMSVESGVGTIIRLDVPLAGDPVDERPRA